MVGARLSCCCCRLSQSQVSRSPAAAEVGDNFARLGRVECRGTIVTALSDDPRFDFVSRFFAPAVGVDEDPVTGSAHTCLAESWARRLGKTQFVAFQASPRGGILDVELAGERVVLGGKAIIVAHGELRVRF